MMDLIPPSYKSATDRDAWAIIAHYIPSSDLCAASLVCHRWHDLFMPYLWGDPASHFGTENDAVYVALTRFRRTLKYARREVRALTHTLHLPPALSEIYGGPRPGWLRDILEYLPCLQCLMVSRLPFFDHNAMVALKNHPRSSEYNVRLLLADHEPNTTSAGLAETILRFPRLTYLDLSYTRSARDQSVLSSLSQLENLQVLKLRGIGLKDADAEFLANAIGTRTRFLDVRNNMLTDMAVRSLLQASFTPPDRGNQPSPRRNGISPDRAPPADSQNRQSEFLKSPDLDEQYLKFLAQPGSNNSWIEDLPFTGITHLYIANNPITVEGVASLLASSRLNVLDVGTVNTADAVHRTASKHGVYPGSEKLVPILGNIAGDRLTYFRAHHAVVTAEPPAKDSVPKGEYLPELATSSEVRHEVELDASQEVHELPGEIIPVFELADTSVSESKGSTVTTPVPRLLNPYEDEQLPAVRRGSAFAPEVVLDPGSDSDYTALRIPPPSNQYQPNDEGTLQSISALSVQEDGSMAFIPRCSSPISMDDPRAQRIQELLAKRPRNQSLPLRSGKESRFPYLHPSHVPHLETLVLTDVPSHISPNSPILYTLTRFITACSNETLLATLQAGSDYSLPPGQARIQAEQQRSRTLFGLRRIVLEVTPTDSSTRLTTWKPGVQNSSTGDRDSEALWAAAADDFSFFEEMECGIPENDPGKYFPMAVLNEKVSLMPSDDDASLHSHSGAESPMPNRRISQRSVPSAVHGTPGSPRPIEKASQPTLAKEIDLVAELAAFRRAKKAEYEQVGRRERGRRSTHGTGSSTLLTATTAQVSMAHFVEGHWKGEIKIVRNPTSKMRSGMVDMYGNYFEKGYLYP
ncbi:Leucine Rich Repeat domain protein [Penicillium brasilianum]|uniref:Leucine Rich Repeat domain protein n=1 Tax=Penicillium brasilianum TaxID=104259 RepID=A0A1S9RH09_PENBI|nr:Leucine Rich Repeat domain protein [Penicillium brasilianum]